MQSLLGELINSIVSIPGEFATVAGNDPIGAILMAVGGVLMLVTMGVFGYLSLGAAVDLITPDLSGRAPPQADR